MLQYPYHIGSWNRTIFSGHVKNLKTQPGFIYILASIHVVVEDLAAWLKYSNWTSRLLYGKMTVGEKSSTYNVIFKKTEVNNPQFPYRNGWCKK